MAQCKAQSVRPLAELFSAWGVRGQAELLASETGTTALKLLNLAVESEKARIGDSNDNSRRGRPARTDWTRRWGMDPVDALLIIEIFRRLGENIGQRQLIRLFMHHAIEIDDKVSGQPASTSLKATLTEQMLKRFYEGARAKFETRFETRRAALPGDRAGLQASLACIAASIWPGWSHPKFLAH